MKDWWAIAGQLHAFVAPSFRSLCGAVRWTAAAGRDDHVPVCEACAAAAVPGQTPRMPADHRTPEEKRAMYRRRWHEARGHY